MERAKTTVGRHLATRAMSADQQAAFTRAADALLVELIKSLDRPHGITQDEQVTEGPLGRPARDRRRAAE